jgi:hypothetical protein
MSIGKYIGRIHRTCCTEYIVIHEVIKKLFKANIKYGNLFILPESNIEYSIKKDEFKERKFCRRQEQSLWEKQDEVF